MKAKNRLRHILTTAGELRLTRNYHSMLTVGTDGSMLLTREASWKETKVGVVARGGFIPPGEERKRRRVEDARYVAVLGGQPEFKKALAAALSAERADEVETVVWLGDGARENWTLADELAPFAIQVLDIPHAVHWAMLCGKAFLGEGHCLLPHWEARIYQLIDADGPDEAIAELMACLPFATSDEQLAALDDVVGSYRTNEQRMRYRTFRARGLPVGSGIVESAHRHVLQVRMKRAGQRWSLPRARRMARLRAVYRTTGAVRFHAALRAGLSYPTATAEQRARRPVKNSPRRAKRDHLLSRVSPRAQLASK